MTREQRRATACGCIRLHCAGRILLGLVWAVGSGFRSHLGVSRRSYKAVTIGQRAERRARRRDLPTRPLGSTPLGNRKRPGARPGRRTEPHPKRPAPASERLSCDEEVTTTWQVRLGVAFGEISKNRRAKSPASQNCSTGRGANAPNQQRGRPEDRRIRECARPGTLFGGAGGCCQYRGAENA